MLLKYAMTKFEFFDLRRASESRESALHRLQSICERYGLSRLDSISMSWSQIGRAFQYIPSYTELQFSVKTKDVLFEEDFHDWAKLVDVFKLEVKVVRHEDEAGAEHKKATEKLAWSVGVLKVKLRSFCKKVVEPQATVVFPAEKLNESLKTKTEANKSIAESQCKVAAVITRADVLYY